MLLIYIWMSAQIILEMLPISSSGHLRLLEEIYKKYADLDVADFFKQRAIALKTIYYFLHGPTLLVVLIYFFSQWYALFLPTRSVRVRPQAESRTLDSSYYDESKNKQVLDSELNSSLEPNGPYEKSYKQNSTLNLRPILWVVIADSITLLLYLLLQRIKIPFPLGIGFIITMMSLFYTAWLPGSKSLSWHYTDALILGFAQGVALLPGISRLAFTCAVGCFLGFSLYDAFCISWLIQVPLMAAAFAQSMWKLNYIFFRSVRLPAILRLRLRYPSRRSSGAPPSRRSYELWRARQDEREVRSVRVSAKHEWRMLFLFHQRNKYVLDSELDSSLEPNGEWIAASQQKNIEQKKLTKSFIISSCVVIVCSTAVSWMVLQIMIQAIHANLFFVIGWYMIIPLAIWIALRL